MLGEKVSLDETHSNCQNRTASVLMVHPTFQQKQSPAWSEALKVSQIFVSVSVTTDHL